MNIDIKAVQNVIETAKNSLKAGDNKESLYELYEQQSKVNDALPSTKGEEKTKLQELAAQLKELIDKHLDDLTSGPPELNIDDIAIGKCIGQGAFGKVYKGTLRGTKVAVKIPHKTVTNMEEFRKEVKIMRKVFHPHVVMLIGASTKGDKVVIVSELMSRDLEKFLTSPEYKEIPLAERIVIAKDIALGLNWLHLEDVIHRDLKLGNILLDTHGNAKIADFGFCTQIKRSVQEMLKDKVKPKGNILYMAPEVMKLQPFDQKADVYSYGLIMWEIITGQLWDPPPEYGTAETYKKYICELGERPKIVGSVPTKLADIMKACWHQSANKRPLLTQVVSGINDFLVDIKISGANARAFWKKYFLNKKTARLDVAVGVRLLARLVRKNAGVHHKSEMEGFKAIVSWKWEDVNPKKHRTSEVAIERFDSVTKMFGPFFLPKNKPILVEMSQWHTQDWFHGDISRDMSCSRLRDRSPGYYLVRLSTTKPDFPFTITYINSSSKIGDVRIQLQVDQDKKTVVYTTVDKKGTLKHHKGLGDAIKNCGLKLTHACPREAPPVGLY